jgi:type IV pilus assembly protein PilX
MRNSNTINSEWRQSGATLIVSLVILAVVTLLGVASMRSSNLELRMAASARDRSVAFQAAEAALISLEKSLKGSPGTPPLYWTENLLPSCNASACFKSSCPKGLCFTGDFVGAQAYSDCQLANSSGITDYPWQKKTNWDTPANHDVINVASSAGDTAVNSVKYMIEFLCYVPVDEKINSPAAGAGVTGWVPLFRITTKAEGESGRASVMLQSVIQTASL